MHTRHAMITTLLVAALGCGTSCDRGPASQPQPATPATAPSPTPTPDEPTLTLPAESPAIVDQVAAPACSPGTKSGPSGRTRGLTTAGGLAYEVITPPSYAATRAHPLLVMHPGNLEDEDSFEVQTGATEPATAAGYVIAYADHVSPLDAAAVADAATITQAIAARWCIDPARQYLAGNSDGATLISLNVLDGASRPAAILLNAVGTSGEQLRARACPPNPPAALIAHGDDDQLFPVPQYGIEVAVWWAGCVGCQPSDFIPTNACAQQPGCPAGLAVEYCQMPLPHGRWPTLAPGFEDFDSRMIAFFDAHPAR